MRFLKRQLLDGRYAPGMIESYSILELRRIQIQAMFSRAA
jgi:hypothetical protein